MEVSVTERRIHVGVTWSPTFPLWSPSPGFSPPAHTHFLPQGTCQLPLGNASMAFFPRGGGGGDRESRVLGSKGAGRKNGPGQRRVNCAHSQGPLARPKSTLESPPPPSKNFLKVKGFAGLTSRALHFSFFPFGMLPPF